MRFRTLLGGTAAIVLMGLPGAAFADPGSPTGEPEAPLYGTEATGAIPGDYIVVLRDGMQTTAADASVQQAQALGAVVKYQYSAAIKGYAATLSNEALAQVRKDPNVAFVEADSIVVASETQPNPPSWGLDRIDQRNLPLDASYTYNFAANDVHAYIIDTGIRATHQDFGGRIGPGQDFVDGGAPDDCNGHGTHVAGTVGGSSYGVAKSVTFHGVRVLNCSGSGSTSGVIAGIDWVTQTHQSPAVANMSLGGSASSALDNAVRNSIASGVTYAVAAGNENQNACNVSPARTAEAITVGATGQNDARASFSNYGTCLDLFAPGVSITSAWNSSDTSTNTISGTSMATPHVTGVAALYLDENPSATPQQVRDAIVGRGTPGVVGNPGSGSPNVLLYSLSGTQPPPPSGCAGREVVVSGTLSGTGDVDLYPFTAAAGLHSGCLDGPNGVDFDLYLQKRGVFGWTTVAQGITSAPDENVSYTGTAGSYRWRVVSYTGSGSYTFGSDRP
jgi:aqualysin 1